MDSHLLLDVCGLLIPQCKGVLCGLAGHRPELCIAQRKAQKGDWEPIDEQNGCNVRAWQQLEE